VTGHESGDHVNDHVKKSDRDINHMGSATNPPDFSLLSPFSQESDFHPECFITDYNNQTQVEQCWLGDTTVPLADIKMDDQTIANSFYAWITKLVTD
jgi:alpha-amylase